MKHILSLFAICIYLLATVQANEYLCSGTEVLDACKNPCEPTCHEPNKTPCPTFTCSFGCACKEGTLRDEITGQCVPQRYCTVCPANEVQNDYKTCEPTCQKQNLFQCIFQIKKCICQPGFLRDLNSGKCVRADCCPKECGVDQEWSYCVKTCKTVTEVEICTPGCNCKTGFVWDEETNKCIPEANCPKECGVNEEWGDCCDEPCRSTCQHPGPPACRIMCKPGCSCKDGYLWDENKKQCVLKKDCPILCDGQHQEWKNCSNMHCRPTCQHPDPKVCPMVCIPGCSCEDGYLWDEEKKQCVLKKDCPKLCDGEHQEWKNCSDTHCRPTCQHPDPKFCLMICTPGCSCKDGYIWDEDKKQCVLKKDCPKLCDGEHQEWKNCSDIHCRPTCQHPDPKVCSMICAPGCSCKDGYLWDEEKKQCVLKKDCPKLCVGEHQEWKNCSDIDCRSTCQHPDPKVCTKICTPGCSCKDGYIWDEDKKQCVLKKDCPKLCDDEHQEWKNCSDVHCRPTCQHPDPKFCPMICTPGCSCKDGYIWDEDKKQCVLKKDCPNLCVGEHQEWKKCSDVNCKATCQIAYPILCTMVCIPGCSCIDGYIWDEHSKKCVPRGECSKICKSNAKWLDFIPRKPPTCLSSKEHKPNHEDLQYFKSGCICNTGYLWNEFSQMCVLPKDCFHGH